MMPVYGVHDLSERAAQMGVEWLVDAVAVGHDPNDGGGADYRHWADKGCKIICRLNNGWNPEGTIPQPLYYDDFAQRCANFVQASHGCHIWIVGNEWNLSIERPYGRIITVEQYISCYNKVRAAIKAIAPEDWVVPAGIGPWNVESGDWLQLYQEMLQAVDCEAICWHVYTHGYDPSLVTSDKTMDPPYQDRFYHFWCYRDFERYTPQGKKHLPVLVTEANGDGPWQSTGWIPAAYEEIQKSAMDVHCMCLFRAIRTGDGYGLTEGAWSELEQAMQGENGGNGDMADWESIYEDGLEEPFVDQDGIGELTVPAGHRVVWEGDRPEMDAKVVPQQEVYEGRQSACGFLPFKTFRWWVYTVDPLPVGAGLRTRASAMVMVVAHGIGGDPSRPGACGMRVGVSPATVADQNSPLIQWSDWWVVRGSLDNERVWHKLQTPEFIPTVGELRFWVQCNADVAAQISAGHWDVELIEQYTEGPGPQPPGECLTADEVRQIVREELGNLRLVLD